MAIDPIILKGEITADPKGMGYAALVASGSDGGIAALLNAQTGPGVGTVTLPSLTKDQFLTATAPFLPNLLTASPAIQAKWSVILDHLRAADQLDFTNPAVLALIVAAVTDGLLTSGQASGLNQRNGSRAEVLFGAGSSVASGDVSFAMRGTR